jgi:hypothetical protein
MNNELGRMWKEWSSCILRYYISVYLDGLDGQIKTTKTTVRMASFQARILAYALLNRK